MNLFNNRNNSLDFSGFFNSSAPVVEEFIFKIDTSLGDGLNEFQLKLYSFTSIFVDWGDSSAETFISTSDPLLNHSYSTSGQFTIKIFGSFSIRDFSTTPDKLKLIDVINWGTNINTSFYRAFTSCSNLNISATDYPDLSSAISFEEIFAYCSSLNYPLLSNWDVSNVQNFKWSFRSIPTNHDLSSWNVSSSTILQGIFSNSFSFDVSSWDVSNVTNLEYICLFNSGMTGFDNWDVSSVTNTTYAFFHSSPVMDLSNWNLSSLINSSRMFQNCSSSFSVDTWVLPNLSNAYSMFSNSDNITGLPTFSSSLTSLNYTFSSNNNDFDLTKIDFQNVTNGQYAFNGSGLTSSSYQAGLVYMTGWNGTTATKTLKNNVSFHFGYAQYELGGISEDVRNYLINTLGWTIADGGGI
jgi:surface protein